MLTIISTLKQSFRNPFPYSNIRQGEMRIQIYIVK